MSERLQKVRRELEQYDHPLVEFSAHAAGEGVELQIRLKHPIPGIETYAVSLHPREIDGPQFTWNFQRQLYDCLHDYLIEMFTRNPQMKAY